MLWRRMAWVSMKQLQHTAGETEQRMKCWRDAGRALTQHNEMCNGKELWKGQKMIGRKGQDSRGCNRLGKIFPNSYTYWRHVAIVPTFVRSLLFFFLKSVVDIWFLTGVDRWLWGYQGFIYWWARQRFDEDDYFKLLYMHQLMKHESLLNLKGV
jgi:hypothetical protein